MDDFEPNAERLHKRLDEFLSREGLSSRQVFRSHPKWLHDRCRRALEGRTADGIALLLCAVGMFVLADTVSGQKFASDVALVAGVAQMIIGCYVIDRSRSGPRLKGLA